MKARIGSQATRQMAKMYGPAVLGGAVTGIAIKKLMGRHEREGKKKRGQEKKAADAGSSKRGKALAAILGGLGMGVVGGVTEGVISPAVSAHIEAREKKKKAGKEKHASFFEAFVDELRNLSREAQGGVE